MKQFESKVSSISKVAEGYYQLDFTWPIDTIPKAGQFLTIRTTELSSPLLRRPFALSAYKSDTQSASIIFQVIGEGTKLLCNRKEGDTLDILAPLGNSFHEAVSHEDQKKDRHYIVAGGIGTGPMLYLAEELKKAGKSPQLIIGCRNESLVPFSSLNDEIDTVICTDDGSYGFQGNVVQYMESVKDIDHRAVIYACGPEPMLKGCHNFSEAKNISLYVSLEQMMACGVGACMGCTCEKSDGKSYARVCKDGPVFTSGEVKWT